MDEPRNYGCSQTSSKSTVIRQSRDEDPTSIEYVPWHNYKSKDRQPCFQLPDILITRRAYNRQHCFNNVIWNYNPYEEAMAALERAKRPSETTSSDDVTKAVGGKDADDKSKAAKSTKLADDQRKKD